MIKGANIESRKSDGVNPLVCMLGDKLISHFIPFKRQKKVDRKCQKKRDIGDSRSKSSDLLLEQLRIFFLMKLEKILSQKILDNVKYSSGKRRYLAHFL